MASGLVRGRWACVILLDVVYLPRGKRSGSRIARPEAILRWGTGGMTGGWRNCARRPRRRPGPRSRPPWRPGTPTSSALGLLAAGRAREARPGAGRRARRPDRADRHDGVPGVRPASACRCGWATSCWSAPGSALGAAIVARVRVVGRRSSGLAADRGRRHLGGRRCTARRTGWWGAWSSIRFTDYFVGGPPPPRPGLKTDYATYLRADPGSRAWLHASGAIATQARAVPRPGVLAGLGGSVVERGGRCS